MVSVQIRWMALRSFSVQVRRDSAFGTAGVAMLLIGGVPGALVVLDYIEIGRVSRVGTAVLSLGLVLVGAMSIFSGLILHTIARRFQELDRQVQLFERDLQELRFPKE